MIFSKPDLKTLKTLTRHSSTSLTLDTHEREYPARMRVALDSTVAGGKSLVNVSPCCPYVANEKSALRPTSVSQRVETTSIERRMVEDSVPDSENLHLASFHVLPTHLDL